MKIQVRREARQNEKTVGYRQLTMQNRALRCLTIGLYCDIITNIFIVRYSAIFWKQVGGQLPCEETHLKG